MKKILVVSNVSVPPIIAGSCKCISSYCHLLKSVGYEVHFLYSGYIDKNRIEEAYKFWGDKYHYFKYSHILRGVNFLKRKLTKFLSGDRYPIDYYYPAYGLEPFVKKLNTKYEFDAIIVNYPWMTKLLENVSIPLKLYFTHDMFTDKSKHINAEYYSLTSEQEKTVLDRADIILSIQEAESKYFRTLVPTKTVLSVYTPFEYHATSYSEKSNVLFFSGDSELNRNGIHYFINEVWPLIIEKNNNAKLVIGGGICKSLLMYSGNSSIDLLGYIDDVEQFYSLGNIAINPVYQGTGLKIKTLESLSYGKITIVHPHSIEGIYKQNLAPVIVAKENTSYAKYILDMLNDSDKYYQAQIKIKQYICEMNDFIFEQYKSIKL